MSITKKAGGDKSVAVVVDRAFDLWYRVCASVDVCTYVYTHVSVLGIITGSSFGPQLVYLNPPHATTAHWRMTPALTTRLHTHQ
jgi:hypothetical protein